MSMDYTDLRDKPVADKLRLVLRFENEANDDVDRSFYFASINHATNPPAELSIIYQSTPERSYPRGVGRGAGRGVA